MKLYAEFLDNVMPDLPGCTVEIAENAIRSAAIEFCRRTCIYVYDGDAFVTVAGQSEYDIDLPSQAEPVMAVNVWRDGVRMPPRSLVNQSDNVDVTQLDGPPVEYSTRDWETILLIPTPDTADYTITYKVALMPSRTSTGVPDFLLDRHFDAIASGAKARLMLSPNKPYSSKEFGDYHKKEFESAILDIAVQALKSGTSASLMAKPRSFGG